MGNNKIIGAKIRNIRESKQLSIEEVAERSGLSNEQIERIEGNVDFPSLAPLIKIARVLGVRLGTFLDDQTELGPVVCRHFSPMYFLIKQNKFLLLEKLFFII